MNPPDCPSPVNVRDLRQRMRNEDDAYYTQAVKVVNVTISREFQDGVMVPVKVNVPLAWVPSRIEALVTRLKTLFGGSPDPGWDVEHKSTETGTARPNELPEKIVTLLFSAAIWKGEGGP